MHENIVRIKSVANILRGLGQPYVFVGGATVSLYATHKALAASIRPTDDVDVVLELASYTGYSAMDERLRAIGFENAKDSGVICRYKVDGIIVDIMPTAPGILGFSNKWYPDGFREAVTYTFDDGMEILIFSLPYFLASKWEAHISRGGNDLRTSRDFEDMVYVFENCHDFDRQLLEGPKPVKEYFARELAVHLTHPDFEEALYCHMETSDPNRILQKLKKVLAL
ncbi:nucleotidyl transferase AbiEii/AbiGii toxin family protein [Chitinophaga barathri]|uniref:Nucleotidyl transferase AbiEii/AbiGii toxin family protein n=1 Tax=Chitinophaga barathri TaxID=1647451 RepID=A0A3N4MUN8_9BACT|nr:nucleotidyl transferase AbiEii/AbiGii toxin family protein [Chitinophaga barathri]RPD39173.1 hypothetical protein EG028_21415 [Chitinophaga barathri]